MYYGIEDLIQDSLREGFSAEITTVKMLVILGVAFMLSLYVHIVYRLVTRNAFYYKNFGISMSVISVVTAGIVLAMQSSIVISLGMVGALSIVRFRTAVKDPMDLLFLFWSIGIGIICGADLFQLAVILSVVVTAGIVLISLLPTLKMNYLLIINAKNMEQEKAIRSILDNKVKKYKVRSKNVTADKIEMIMEVKLGKDEQELVQEIQAVSKEINVSLLMHDGQTNM